MTESTRQCRWCGARFVPADGPGRPPDYCRRSHRQRAYEARRLAGSRGIDSDEVLLARATWVQLRDAIYVAEAAARDAEMDLANVDRPDDAREIAASLISVIDQLASTSTEPKAATTPADTSQ